MVAPIIAGFAAINRFFSESVKMGNLLYIKYSPTPHPPPPPKKKNKKQKTKNKKNKDTSFTKVLETWNIGIKFSGDTANFYHINKLAKSCTHH